MFRADEPKARDGNNNENTFETKRLTTLLTQLSRMRTVLLLREIYREGFRNLGHYLVKHYFKLFAWFSFIMFTVVLYAFVYRIFTGFPFD